MRAPNLSDKQTGSCGTSPTGARACDYFAFIHDRDGSTVTAEEFEHLRTEQKRYFAYCLAQLSEAGMELDGLFLTMKGETGV